MDDVEINYLNTFQCAICLPVTCSSLSDCWLNCATLWTSPTVQFLFFPGELECNSLIIDFPVWRHMLLVSRHLLSIGPSRLKGINKISRQLPYGSGGNCTIITMVQDLKYCCLHIVMVEYHGRPYFKKKKKLTPRPLYTPNWVWLFWLSYKRISHSISVLQILKIQTQLLLMVIILRLTMTISSRNTFVTSSE